MPFRNLLKDRVTLIGTPDFGLPDYAPGHCRNALVVRANDGRGPLAAFVGATFACNHPMSQSDFGAPLVAAEHAGLRFGRRLPSGSHAASARMVAEGQAEIAGIDAVSWRHMQRFDPWTAQLRVLDWTQATPGLLFITAQAPLVAPASRRSSRPCLPTFATVWDCEARCRF